MSNFPESNKTGLIDAETSASFDVNMSTENKPHKRNANFKVKIQAWSI